MNGPKLFNSLTKNIRDTRKVSIDDFKQKLDTFLALLPDQPKISDLV